MVSNPATMRGLQPRHHAQQRGLAAARWADEDQELAVVDLQIDALDHVHVAEALVHAAQRYLAHVSAARPFRRY